MPYVLVDDRHKSDPVWSHLADGKAARVVIIRDAYVCLMTASAEQLTDGYLTLAMATTALRDHTAADQRRLPALLSEPVLGRPVKLHRRGDECACIPRGWDEGWDFYIHEFLKHNPSKRQKTLRDGKRRDLADPGLRALVLHRDGSYCRYCWSGPLNNKLGAAKFPEAAQLRLTYDHVDPEAPAGPDGANLVIACQRCNQAKGPCTPEVAGMPVLPAPTAEEAAALPVNFRGKYTLLGRPNETPDHPLNQREITDPVIDPYIDPTIDPHGDLDAGPGPVPSLARPECPGHTPDHPCDVIAPLSGSGRVGPPVIRSESNPPEARDIGSTPHRPATQIPHAVQPQPEGARS
ncbi:hypothetical protein A8W25_09805 [Streptomyces sp. ERV7]|uniref:HNH endonuclease n=1 Tax=Streptomyces sp. ERV7 TaxID=1322334 RepID=UPI0007F4F3CB|nr:HNH endonuclease signature motif containing protein [Streptomyces sp. ERV7]OAR25819.1 hypothetical protein A8W25_09805 [Streptomyces sp. ERV7]